MKHDVGNMLSVVEDKSLIDTYQIRFQEILKNSLTDIYENVEIGFQGGNEAATAYHSPSPEINYWFAPVKSHNRYWNAFGLEVRPERNVNITVEINFPFAFTRSIDGLFLDDGDGHIFIGHRGAGINSRAGSPSIGLKKKTTLRKFEKYIGSLTTVQDGERESGIILISPLDESMPKKIKEFLSFVKRVKDEHKENPE